MYPASVLFSVLLCVFSGADRTDVYIGFTADAVHVGVIAMKTTLRTFVGRQLDRFSARQCLTRNPCAHKLCAMNVTLSISDTVVAEARRIAAARGTSLNQMVRDYLRQLTRADDLEGVVAELKERWAAENYRSEGEWTREELHERTRVP